MPGMLDMDGCRAVLTDEGVRLTEHVVHADAWGEHVDVVDVARTDRPDLDDPATIGCLLALVREAWGRENIWIRRLMTPGMQKWEVCMGARGLALGCTEAEALVCALEAAPPEA